MIGDTLVVHNYGHGGSGWSLSWGSADMAVQKAMSVSPKEIAVVGCGIIGLTSAITAQRAGARVTIYTREMLPRTRSVRANGSWTPDSRIALTSAAPANFGETWEQMARMSWKTLRTYLGLPGDPVAFSDHYGLSDAPRVVGQQRPPDPNAPPLPPRTWEGAPTQNSDFARYNDRIRISPVRLINDKDEMVGIVPTAEALRMAREAQLDLVEVAPNARPPVCKILDFGKWKYQQQKKEQKSHAHGKGGQLKELKFRPVRIGDHDLEIKINHAKGFLEEGNKVQFTLQFETLGEAPDQAETAPEPAGKATGSSRNPSGKAAKTSVPATKLPAAPAAETRSKKSASGEPAPDTEPEFNTCGGAEVVRLDRFRKK